jgi:hypothetical protein
VQFRLFYLVAFAIIFPQDVSGANDESNKAEWIRTQMEALNNPIREVQLLWTWNYTRRWEDAKNMSMPSFRRADNLGNAGAAPRIPGLFQVDPEANWYAKVSKDLERGRTEYFWGLKFAEERAAALVDPSNFRPEHQLFELAKLNPNFTIAATVAEKLLKQELLPEVGTSMLDTVNSFYSVKQQALSDIYATCNRNPDLRERIVDPWFKLHSGVSMTEEAARIADMKRSRFSLQLSTIENRIRTIRDPEVRRRYENSLDKMKKGMLEIRRSEETAEAQLADFNEARANEVKDQIQKGFDEIVELARQRARDAQTASNYELAQRQEAIRREIDQMNHQAIKSALDGFSAFLAVGLQEKQAAVVLSAVGNSYLKLSEAFTVYDETIKKGASQGLATAGLMGNYISVATSLMQLAIGAPSFEEIVLRELQNIQQMVTDLHREMRFKLETIDSKLDFIYKSFQHELVNLSEGQQEIHRNLKTVLQRMQSLEEKLYFSDRSTRSNLIALSDENQFLQGESCSVWAEQFHKEKLLEHKELLGEKFLNCMTALYACVVQTSANGMRAGDTTPVGTTAGELPILEHVLQDGQPESEIAPLIEMARRRGFRISTQPGRTINRIMLAKCAQLYLKTALEYPTFYNEFVVKSGPQSQIEKMLAVARKSLDQSGDIRASLKQSGNPFRSLISEYIQKQRTLVGKVAERRLTYLSGPIPGTPYDLQGFDPQASIETYPANLTGDKFGIKNLTVCSPPFIYKVGGQDLAIDASQTYIFPEDGIKSLVPAPFATASSIVIANGNITRGKINICIERITQLPRPPGKVLNDTQYVEVVLRGTYIDNVTKKVLPIFIRSERLSNNDIWKYSMEEATRRNNGTFIAFPDSEAFLTKLPEFQNRTYPHVINAGIKKITDHLFRPPAFIVPADLPPGSGSNLFYNRMTGPLQQLPRNESEQSAAEIERILTETLRAISKALRDQLAHVIEVGDLKEAADAVSHSRDTIIALMLLGWNSRANSDLELRAIFDGPLAIPNRVINANYYKKLDYRITPSTTGPQALLEATVGSETIEIYKVKILRLAQKLKSDTLLPVDPKFVESLNKAILELQQETKTVPEEKLHIGYYIDDLLNSLEKKQLILLHDQMVDPAINLLRFPLTNKETSIIQYAENYTKIAFWNFVADREFSSRAKKLLSDYVEPEALKQIELELHTQKISKTTILTLELLMLIEKIDKEYAEEDGASSNPDYLIRTIEQMETFKKASNSPLFGAETLLERSSK